MRKKISIVIPTYNEEANVVPLSKAVIEVMERDLSEYDYEILFIDNHSKDNTQALLRGLCANNKKIKAIFNAKNFGQARSPVYGMNNTDHMFYIRKNICRCKKILWLALAFACTSFAA